MFRIFKPEVYQGNKRLKNYFEGWYFKQVSDDEKKVFAFIPGISLNPSDPHSFIQYINGISGETHYIRYELDDFQYKKNRFELSLANSFFSADGFILDISNNHFRAKGEVRFHNRAKFPSSLFSPGIMGWYSFVPLMECKHGIVSMNHYAEGSIIINSEKIELQRGKSYTEKDWGRSFPSAWIWMQSNNFNNPDASLMLSVARIPWLGSYFMGFISFMYLEGKTYLFSSYNKSIFKLEDYNDQEINVRLENRESILKLNIQRKKSGELMAPAKGKMNRMIKESVDSAVEVELFDKSKKLLFHETGRRAGLEVTSNIFELLQKSV